MDQNIKAINEKVNQKESLFVQELMREIGKNIVGQQMMVERLLIGVGRRPYSARGSAGPGQNPGGKDAWRLPVDPF